MTILLIEDNASFSEFVELSLDAKVHVAQTLAEAKQWLSTFRPNLILVDLGLPDSQGMDTLRALQGIRAPKVVLTAGEHCPQEVIKAGGLDYIPKTNVSAMLERIEFHMERLVPKPRFSPQVFEEIKACLGSCHELVHVS